MATEDPLTPDGPIEVPLWLIGAIEDLGSDQIDILKAVTVDNLQCEVLGTFEDDHMPGIAVRINGVDMTFWWQDAESIGAFFFMDSPTARSIVITTLQLELDKLKEPDHA